MKVLVVKLSAFGDIIHALPALDDLLKQPEVSEVHWLVDTRYAFVTGVFPPQVKVHRIDLKGSSNWREVRTTLRRLKNERFDAVLDLQGLIKSGLIARLVGKPVFGVDEKFMREKLNRCFVRPVHFHPGERHVVQQSRRIAAALFVPHPERTPDHALPYREPKVALRPEMKQAAMRWLGQWRLDRRRYAWLHLGGGWATKQLPLNTWEAVANGLEKSEIIPVLGWGNGREHAVAEQLSVRVGGAVLPETRLDILPLCGVLAQAKAVVGADTGVMHLAAALGAPTVSFWGPSASWRSAPLAGTNQRVESNPPCGPCFARTCRQFICMDMISADAILAAIHASVKTA